MLLADLDEARVVEDAVVAWLGVGLGLGLGLVLGLGLGLNSGCRVWLRMQ